MGASLLVNSRFWFRHVSFFPLHLEVLRHILCFLFLFIPQKAAAGLPASARVLQWQGDFKQRINEQSGIDLQAKLQRMKEAAAPLEHIQFGTCAGDVWSSSMGELGECEFDAMLRHAEDTILHDITQPLTTKAAAAQLSTREQEWSDATKLYGQHDAEVSRSYKNIVMSTYVRVAKAVMLMSLKIVAGRPMKLKRLLAAEKSNLVQAGWWEEVHSALRFHVDQAVLWTRGGGTVIV